VISKVEVDFIWVLRGVAFQMVKSSISWEFLSFPTDCVYQDTEKFLQERWRSFAMMELEEHFKPT
jgi:hypothetical protein